MTISLSLVLFLGLLVIGLPVFLALGMTSLVLFWVGTEPIIGLATQMLNEINSSTLLAVPFFVMAAVFMERGGIARALVEFAAVWVGRVRGGLGIVCVVACSMFAAICGSSVATALAMGTVMLPPMLDRGYDKRFAYGLIAASGTLGILIPPSLPMILFALVADQSVPRLFLAGIVPGLLQALIFAAWSVIHGYRHGYPKEPAMDRKAFFAVNGRALPALAVPVIVAVGIYGGLVTVTEAAALSAAVALLVSIVVYRGFTWLQVPWIVSEALLSCSKIIIIVIVALIFGHWMTKVGVSQALVNFVIESGLNAWQFLLVVNILLLFLGVFLEGASMILIAVPLLVPVLKPLGIDPVHFAVIVTLNVEIALIHPPIGLNLFVLSSLREGSMPDVVMGVMPFLLLLLLLLAAVTFVPALSLWLPTLVYG
jgi:C4-dicarboxylate transporter, DctM subunit